MKVLVTGSRTWDAWLPIRLAFAWLTTFTDGETTLIHGNARGADKMAGWLAKQAGWTVIPVDADWDTHGKTAGFRRNAEMLDYDPDVVIAFSNRPITRGTQDMVDRALKKGTPTWLVTEENIAINLQDETRTIPLFT